jgi:hypothetical protein
MKLTFTFAFTILNFAVFSQVLEKPQVVENTEENIIEVNAEVGEVEPPLVVEEALFGQAIDQNRTPSFPGGQDSLNRYIKEAVEQFIFADTSENFPWGESVYVAFKISSEGNVTDPIIEMGYNALLDSAALEIVRNMPLWQPATNDNGDFIESSYRLQILFDFDLGLDELDWESELAKNKAHWAGFEFGLQMNTAGFLEPSTTFDAAPYWQNNVAKSLVFNLNTFQHKFSLIADVFGITTGYGFAFNNTELTSSYILKHDDQSVYAISDTAQIYKRNTLYAAYFTVPLLLDFTANNSFKNSFYVNAGVVGGVRMYSHQRLTGTYANGDKFENTTKSDFNMNSWMLDATLRMGYGYFGVFANYAMVSMFNQGTTVGVYPLRFGISFNIPQ